MKAGTPFKAAQIAFAAIAAAMCIAAPLERAQALAGITPYKGRGKGRGGVSPNWLRPLYSSKYRPHEGKREVARRLRQMRHGILNADNGLVVA